MNVTLNFKDRLAGLRVAPRTSHRNRFFQVEDEGWYLNAREGIQGPFASLEEAEAWLEKLISRQGERGSPH